MQAKGAMPHHGTSGRGKCGGLAGIQRCPCQNRSLHLQINACTGAHRLICRSKETYLALAMSQDRNKSIGVAPPCISRALKYCFGLSGMQTWCLLAMRGWHVE